MKANRLTANAADLAADYKARGIDRQASYSFFVKDRGLKPEINSKEFFFHIRYCLSRANR
jgi:hypothetical protein